MKEGGAIEKGDRVGKYMIIRALGRGGEGTVYLVMHVQTQQLWAMKEYHEDEDSGLTEVRALRRLHHKALPAVVDVLEEKGNRYLIMEYVQGRTLGEMIQNGNRLSEEQVMDVGVQMGEALRYLHHAKPCVLHLDIKPDNIILKKNGRLVLVDFGAAYRMDGGKLLGKGTDDFAPPELFDLKGKVDARSDLYELGAVMYVLISGKTYSERMFKSRVPGCSDKLSDLIRNCLAADPDERYQTADDFLAALHGIKHSENREKHRIRIWSAVILLLILLIYSSRLLPSQITGQIQKEWDEQGMGYTSVEEQTDGHLVPIEQIDDKAVPMEETDNRVMPAGQADSIITGREEEIISREESKEKALPENVEEWEAETEDSWKVMADHLEIAGEVPEANRGSYYRGLLQDLLAYETEWLLRGKGTEEVEKVLRSIKTGLQEAAEITSEDEQYFAIAETRLKNWRGVDENVLE